MRAAPVQTVRLGIQGIADGVVASTEGEYHAVLEVGGTASPFEDDARQEAVLAGFSTFLNALGYPIQILVRATPVDLSRYVAALEERGRQALDGELAELAHDHALFVQSLARQRTLLERRFYVIVSAESVPRRHRWFGKFGADRAAEDEPRRAAARHQLTFRCDDVARQLARCGLIVRRLTDLDLAELYAACWSPERARVQRFRQQLDDYTTFAVRSGPVRPPGAA
ncbi:MAG TPA: hypothetical protein VGQ62_24535 [Chloroflexota bacterium]|jgi:hypothetical protein|nr:hypothetical protein [Chloroflexota bacterium]